MDSIFYILIISLVVVLFIAVTAITILNIKASKIKKQVLSGTYVSKNNNSNVKNNIDANEGTILKDTSKKEKTNSYSEEELKKMTVLDLKELMKYEKIKFNSNDRKTDLINKILEWYER